MLQELLFVQGSVARKDFQPALQHFHINGGKIQGYNGVLSISSPIALDLDVTPNAQQLIKAIRSCTETMALSMTAGGRLAIKSGKFKAFVDCYPGGFPEIRPNGKRVELPATFLTALKILQPCIAEDASRQWARGILLRGNCAYATNNIILAEYQLGAQFPHEINLPAETVAELIRLGEAPEAMLFDEGAATFLYPGDRWLRSQLYTTEWPDLSRVLGATREMAALPFSADALNPLMDFLDDGGRIYFLENELATSLEDGAGARLEVEGLKAGGIFNAKMLGLILERASGVCFEDNKCFWVGPNMRGALVGMRG